MSLDFCTFICAGTLWGAILYASWLNFKLHLRPFELYGGGVDEVGGEFPLPAEAEGGDGLTLSFVKHGRSRNLVLLGPLGNSGEFVALHNGDIFMKRF